MTGMAADCIHGIPRRYCTLCTSPIASPTARRTGPVSWEPAGHRGHPDAQEVERADVLRPRLEKVIARLAANDVKDPIGFMAEICRMNIEMQEMEEWGTWEGPKLTIRNIIQGRAAKHWSLDVIEAAMRDAERLLD